MGRTGTFFHTRPRSQELGLIPPPDLWVVNFAEYMDLYRRRDTWQSELVNLLQKSQEIRTQWTLVSLTFDSTKRLSRRKHECTCLQKAKVKLWHTVLQIPQETFYWSKDPRILFCCTYEWWEISTVTMLLVVPDFSCDKDGGLGSLPGDTNLHKPLVTYRELARTYRLY